MNAATKPCSRCGEVKVLEDFSCDKRNKDGRQSRCKACERERKRERYRERRADPEYRARVRERQRERYRNDADYRARECERARRWRAENREAKREHNRRWCAENPGKNAAKGRRYTARKLGVEQPRCPGEHILIAALYQRARDLTELIGEPYQVDHIIPLSQGGPHQIQNLHVVTGEENLRKHARCPLEFYGLL